MPIDRVLPKLNTKEIASLVVLMAEARELTNTELKQLSGFDLVGQERRNLNELKYVESRKVGRTFAHELTDQGWRACRDLWRIPRPAGSGSAGGALFALLAGLDRGLARNRLSPADFFAERAAGLPEAEGVGAGSAGPALDAAGSGFADTLDAAIRSAYHALAKEPGDWVGLAALRAELGQYGRDQTDEALRRLAKAPDAHLIPVANLKSLTQADRDAALSLGGEDNHALSIEGA
jgi:hypothetical protein